MGAAKFFGIVILLIGALIAGDYRLFGLKTPAGGIAIAGAGMFLLLYAVFGDTVGGNKGGSGRRVRDHSI